MARIFRTSPPIATVCCEFVLDTGYVLDSGKPLVSARTEFQRENAEPEKRRFPHRIFFTSALSGISIATYTIVVMSARRGEWLDEWVERCRPAVSSVYSMFLTRTNIASHDSASEIGDRLDLMAHVYAISWITGFLFFVILSLTTLVSLRNYYVSVSLPKFPKNKMLVDHIAWKFGWILGCWSAAAYGGELSSIVSRTVLSSVFIPLTFYFVLAFLASLLAHFRFRQQEESDSRRI